MTAIPNGAHSLIINSDSWAGWRAKCSCGGWYFADQSGPVIREAHDAHLQDVLREMEANDANR